MCDNCTLEKDMRIMLHPTERFSTRVDNYVKYRPDYPPEVLELLKAECGLTPRWTVADIGSGTGILSRILLVHGNRVFGIEPNREMREAGERLLAGYPDFTSTAGTAEATTLPDHSVDLVTAAQAAHWFDLRQARAEVLRILRPGGWASLIWNNRRTDTTPFLRAYARFVHDYGIAFETVNHANLGPADFQTFFGPGRYRLRHFPNVQTFDFDGLAGRVLSSSYMPEPGHPNYEPMAAALQALFDAHQVNGQVSFEYDTDVFYGQPGD
jgi:SAM-dependent methyltransferase